VTKIPLQRIGEPEDIARMWGARFGTSLLYNRAHHLRRWWHDGFIPVSLMAAIMKHDEDNDGNHVHVSGHRRCPGSLTGGIVRPQTGRDDLSNWNGRDGGIATTLVFENFEEAKLLGK